MTCMEPGDQSILSAVWRSAAEVLSIRIEAPYLLKAKNGAKIHCIAYLPDFGSPNGMVIGFTCGPSYEIDKALKSAAEAQNVFCSFVNFEAYKIYNEEVFKEALSDWGFYGTKTLRPSWLSKQSEIDSPVPGPGHGACGNDKQ